MRVSYDSYIYEVDDAVSDEVSADLEPKVDTSSELQPSDEIQYLTTLTNKCFKTERAVLKEGDLIPTPVSEVESKRLKLEYAMNAVSGLVQQTYIIPRLASSAFRSRLARLRGQPRNLNN
mmetsp:Transcript_832/g.1014  ORF Transcript_832/g.1014 Transcript_832/m.1014 type:complete len:120 (+) Transcript_832:104-463(+)